MLLHFDPHRAIVRRATGANRSANGGTSESGGALGWGFCSRIRVDCPSPRALALQRHRSGPTEQPSKPQNAFLMNVQIAEDLDGQILIYHGSGGRPWLADRAWCPSRERSPIAATTSRFSILPPAPAKLIADAGLKNLSMPSRPLPPWGVDLAQLSSA